MKEYNRWRCPLRRHEKKPALHGAGDISILVLDRVGAVRSGDQSEHRIDDQSSNSSAYSAPATIARSSFDGLKTGTGRAETSTGEPVRGFRAMRVLRCRILNVPNPRTSMFFCCCSASLIASRNESTTRAQSFFEIIGPAVCEICAVTRSTKSAFVIDGPREGRVRTDVQRLETRPLNVVCQALGSLEAATQSAARDLQDCGRVR